MLCFLWTGGGISGLFHFYIVQGDTLDLQRKYQKLLKSLQGETLQWQIPYNVTMDLKTALPQVQATTQQDLENFFSDYRQRVADIDPWAVQVVDRLAEFCLRPGKRVRALLVAVGASMASSRPLTEVLKNPTVRQTMMMIELKHARLLILDDVGDRDDYRRGELAFHKKWESDLQLNPNYQHFDKDFQQHIARAYTEVAGAQLDAMATWILTDSIFSDQQRRDLLEIMQEHIYDKTTTGWYVIFDQNFEPLTVDTSEERLIQGLELVSGEYTFVSPLRMGAALGEKNNERAKLIRAYGKAAGIVFQIQDDILGTFGDTAKTGKPVGNDLREGKKTLLVQFAFRQGDQKQRQILSQLVGNEQLTTAQVEQLQDIITELGGLDYAAKKAKEYAQTAVEAAKKMPPGENQEILLELIDYIQNRQK